MEDFFPHYSSSRDIGPQLKVVKDFYDTAKTPTQSEASLDL